MSQISGNDELALSGVPQPTEEPSFLRDPAMDAMLDAVIALTAELWVERDRRMILEQILEQRGLLTAQQIEQFRGSEQVDQDRQHAREALVRRVLASLNELPAAHEAGGAPRRPSA